MPGATSEMTNWTYPSKKNEEKNPKPFSDPDPTQYILLRFDKICSERMFVRKT
jgi:hypothetical protein